MALGPVPRVVVKVLPGARWRRGGLGVFRGAGSPVFSFLSRRQHRLSLAPSFLGQTLCCLRGTIFQYPPTHPGIWYWLRTSAASGRTAVATETHTSTRTRRPSCQWIQSGVGARPCSRTRSEMAPTSRTRTSSGRRRSRRPSTGAAKRLPGPAPGAPPADVHGRPRVRGPGVAYCV